MNSYIRISILFFFTLITNMTIASSLSTEAEERGINSTFFENSIQYHNVLQCSDYIDCFEKNKFAILEIDRKRINIDKQSIHPEWENYSKEDLETTRLNIICKKT